MITADESRHCLDQEERFVVYPEYAPWSQKDSGRDGAELPDGFSYTSANNDRWLTADEIRTMAERIKPSVLA